MSYIALATTTLTRAVSSVTFSSIPGTYRDLILVQSSLVTGGSSYSSLRFNNDSTGYYSVVTMRGNGSSAISNFASSNSEIPPLPFSFESTTERVAAIFQIFDYAQTDKHKTVLVRGNTASLETSASAQRWPSTSAITSIQARAVGSNFAIGSTFSLYGVA